MIRLIVGLGNPGKTYENTRHNAGAWLVQQFCREYYGDLRLKTAFHAKYTTLKVSETFDAALAIPTTFMNQSGRTVDAIARYYKIPLKAILVVHDELDFLPGAVKFKFGGGTGGHNGLKDIVTLSKGCDFWRLRIGIGHPQNKGQVPQYVLGAPQSVEFSEIQAAIKKAIVVLPDFCMGKTESAIQALHSRTV